EAARNAHKLWLDHALLAAPAPDLPTAARPVSRPSREPAPTTAGAPLFAQPVAIAMGRDEVAAMEEAAANARRGAAPIKGANPAYVRKERLSIPLPVATARTGPARARRPR